MRKRKITAIILTLVLVFATATSAFASIAEGSTNSNSDRFRYEYDETDLTLVNTYTITAEQAQNAETARNYASSILSLSNVNLAKATALVITLGNDIYDMNGPGTMEVYESVKTKYKINVVTGNRSIVGKWRTNIFELYDETGSLKNTRTHTIREK